MIATATTCPRCDEPRDGSSLDGLCPRCVALDFFDDAPGPEEAARGVPMGDYEIFEEIARGGMGAVYRARQVSLDRIVAVKMIIGGALQGGEALARFKTEAAAAAGLRHPHIVAIYDIGEEDGMPFFSMEYIEGQSLSALLHEGPLPARRAAELMEKIAGAVAHAHAHGVLHRDLKPGNVLLDAAGEPRVADFGLAKRLGSGDDLTLSGQVLGTPGYLAPEQARGQSHKAGPLVDVYGLGAILYHALTGRAPFVGEDPMAVLRQIESADPPSLRLLNPSVPADLEAVALKCLAREPGRRYASAQHLAEEMRRWLDGKPVLAKPVTSLAKGVRWVRRNPGVAGAAAAIFLLLASVAVISTISARRLEISRNAEAGGRKALRRTVYATGLRVAQQLHDEGAFANVSEWIDAQSPPPGDEDLRTFEWRLLRAWARGGQDSVLALGDSPSAGALSPCGRFATGWNSEHTILHDLRSGLDAGAWVDEARPSVSRRHVVARPDGMQIVATSLMGVRRWSASAREVRVLATWPADAAAFSPDGKLLAVAAYSPQPGAVERGVVIFNATTWEEAGAFDGPVSGLLWRDDGLMALNAASGEIQWWTPGAAQPVRAVRLAGWAGGWVTPWFSADGRRVAVVRPGEGVRVHDTATGALVAEIPGLVSKFAVGALSRDGRRLALSSQEEIIRVHDLAAPGTPPARLAGHRGQLHGLLFAEDGRLVSWSADGTLRRWSPDVAGVPPVVAPKTIESAQVPPVVSPDGRWIALADEAPAQLDGPAHCVIWDPAARKKIAECDALPLAAMADGRELIALRAGRFIAWHDAATGAKLREAALPEVAQARLPRVSPDGRYAAWWTNATHGFIHDIQTGELFLEMAHGTTDARFSPDGKSVALMTARIGIRVIDLATKAERPPLLAPAGKIEWSRDSQRLAFILQNSPPVLAVAEVKTLQITGTLTGQGADIGHFAFTRDGQTLVSSASDGALRFWHLPTWSRTLLLPASGAAGSLAFTADDSALIVGRAAGFTLLEAPHTLPAAPDHAALAEAAMERVLRALYAACRAHERAHGAWPESLEAVRAAWPADVPRDAVPWSSLLYAYENTPAILPPDPEIAWTENEPPTQRQLTALLLPRAGARLPVLRCIARQWQAGRVLNVAHDGAVYFSSADWREAAH